MRAIALSAILMLSALTSPGGVLAQGVGDRPMLTVWLMPNEPAAKVNPKAEIDAEVEQFNKELAELSVVVQNTTDDYPRQQLLRWNPDFAVPEWPIIKGQIGTLRALGSFTAKHKVKVRVRIVTWATAFKDLQEVNEKKEGGQQPPRPDVAQVGSTWIAHLHKRGRLIAPATDAQRAGLLWRTLPNSGKITLRYIHDIRLLFYWKRLPEEPPDALPFTLASDSWEAIIESFKKDANNVRRDRPGPPMAMPIGYGLRLLHDYAPLVWAGGGEFLKEGSRQVDLTSPNALRIPLLLSKEGRQVDSRKMPHRIIAFPEMSHEELLSHHYLLGRYRAVIEPLAFFRRWKQDFEKMRDDNAGGLTKKSKFWDYCAVAVPPTPFKGGSDLMVVEGTSHPDLAFQLAHFLASDEQCVQLLGELGHLPAQDRKNNFGVGALLKSMDTPDVAQEEITRLILRAMGVGREYPHLEQFATDAESQEAQEAMQRVWRRIGEGADNNSRITKAAEAAQELMNVSEIERQKRAELERQRAEEEQQKRLQAEQERQQKRELERQRAEDERRKWYTFTLVAGGISCALVVLFFWGRAKVMKTKNTALEERAKILEETRLIWGSAPLALAAVDCLHEYLRGIEEKHHFTIYAEASAPLKRKARVIAKLLIDWVQKPPSQSEVAHTLDVIAGQALLTAVDSIDGTCYLNDWTKSNQSLSAYLCAQSDDLGLIRLGSGPGSVLDEQSEKEDSPAFRLDCPKEVIVRKSFLLKHILVCLLQNAIQHSQDRSTGKWMMPIDVRFLAEPSPMVEVSSSGTPLPQELHNALNSSDTIAVFKERVFTILGKVKPANGNWPGLGLVQAFCLARHCFNGITTRTEGNRTCFLVHLGQPQIEEKK